MENKIGIREMGKGGLRMHNGCGMRNEECEMGRSERGICERWASGRLFFIHSYVLCFLEMVSFPFFFLCVAPPGLLLFLLPFLSFNFFLCVCACVCMCVESFFLYFFLISYTQLPFSLIHFFLGFFIMLDP